MARAWNCGPGDGREPRHDCPLASPALLFDGRHDRAAIKPGSNFYCAVASYLSCDLHRSSKGLESHFRRHPSNCTACSELSDRRVLISTKGVMKQNQNSR